MGEILCSFQLIPSEEVQKIPLNDITPKMKDSRWRWRASGARDAQYDNAPIQKPYVRSTAATARPRTSTSDHGVQAQRANANFLETLTIATRLPCDILFCPRSACASSTSAPPRRARPVRGQADHPPRAVLRVDPEAEYVPNNKPRVPPFKVSDE